VLVLTDRDQLGLRWEQVKTAPLSKSGSGDTADACAAAERLADGRE
jgi:hypothetical protein